MLHYRSLMYATYVINLQYNVSYKHVLRNDTILPCIEKVTICYRLLLYVTHVLNQWFIHCIRLIMYNTHNLYLRLLMYATTVIHQYMQFDNCDPSMLQIIYVIN